MRIINDICFSLESNHEFGEDVTPDMLRTALLKGSKTWTMQMSGERFTNSDVEKVPVIWQRSRYRSRWRDNGEYVEASGKQYWRIIMGYKIPDLKEEIQFSVFNYMDLDC